ncbi:translation initiation factor IF-2 associated domain-containing protein, partial [Stappia sp.]|uniref:translation initiation factor IF-2 associated domain-containing protein n=1 Tax=Stappia sp. TaxID=1870903 RepID=UPI003A99B8C5
MSETKNPGDKTISMERKTLGLKRSGVEQGTVRQSFSHGRTKAVVVEKKKRRVVLPGETAKPEHEAEPAAKAPPVRERRADIEPGPANAAADGAAARRAASGQRPRGGNILRTLTDDEAAARQAALIEAQRRDIEDRKRREEEERLRAIEDERRKVEEAARAKQ